MAGYVEPTPLLDRTYSPVDTNLLQVMWNPPPGYVEPVTYYLIKIVLIIAGLRYCVKVSHINER